jgi:glucose/arabinose dehydrogenase/cytochrome c2
MTMKSNNYRVHRLIASSVVALCALSFGTALAQMPAAAPATAPATAPVADPEKGQQLFQQRCSLCHAVDASAVAQGPRLNGVVGRTSASLAEFPYTDVLRRMRVTWDEKSLDRFLANPMLVAPGTSMPIGLPDAKERRDVIAYLTTLSPGASDRDALTAATTNDPGHWRYAKPGMTYRIDVDALPKPYASRSTGNFPRIVDKPADAQLSAPEGFIVKPFATGLQGPRTIRVAPNGDIFVAETRSGRITAIRATVNGDAPQQTQIFASGLKQPFGIAFYPLGPDPRWVYVASNNSVVRFAYKNGDLQARSREQVVVKQLSPTSGGHSTRDIVFSKDGKRMFVSVGSASNVGEGMSAKSADELKRWQTSMPVGAAWGSEANRATVLAFTPEGKSEKIFATGLRNCVGMAVEPTNGDLWCVVNERDALGDDLVPDYATRVRENGFYGWPWYYLGKNEDPRLPAARTDLADKVIVPDVLLQAHSAPLQIAFYDGAQGSSVFPLDYRGDAFIAMHGSWNRGQRTGYKIVRLRMNAGVPTGEYEDFVTGFVVDDRSVWGRPVGVAVARDGSLLVSDDAANTIWRVSFSNPISK